MDGGFEVGEGGGDDRRVVVDEGEEVEADGVEVEGFLLEVGVGRRDLGFEGFEDLGIGGFGGELDWKVRGSWGVRRRVMVGGGGGGRWELGFGIGGEEFGVCGGKEVGFLHWLGCYWSWLRHTRVKGKGKDMSAVVWCGDDKPRILFSGF
jgi:hypothetical protein